MADADVQVAAVGHLDDDAAGRRRRRLGLEGRRAAVRGPVAERVRERGPGRLGVHVAHDGDDEPVRADVVAVVRPDVVGRHGPEPGQLGLGLQDVVRVRGPVEPAREGPRRLRPRRLARAPDAGRRPDDGLLDLGVLEGGLAELLGQERDHVRDVVAQGAAREPHPQAVGVERELGAPALELFGDLEPVAVLRPLVQEPREQRLDHVVGRPEVGRGLERAPEADHVADVGREGEQPGGAGLEVEDAGGERDVGHGSGVGGGLHAPPRAVIRAPASGPRAGARRRGRGTS